MQSLCQQRTVSVSVSRLLSPACCSHAAKSRAVHGRMLVCRVVAAGKQQQQAPAATPPPPGAAASVSSVDKWAIDEDKERSRKYRRVTFDHDLWAKHRSTSRYWRHVQSMPRSRVVKALAAPMSYVAAVATAVCFYESLLEKHALPDWGFDWPGLAVSTTGVYSLSTFALSLLLVFRTNSSYQRWNDARKLWGLTTNRCRDLSRQVLQWMTDPSDAELAAACCRLIRAFPVALMGSLRIDHDMRRDLAALLQPHELQVILQQPHTGTAILQALGAHVAASHIKEVQKLRIDENLTVLQDTMGGCERIFRTPIPLIYSRHTSRFLLCWLTILPFCTAGQVGWLTVPIACAMAFFLLGIEEIGVQVEEPFGILALEIFCEGISKNVQQAEQAAAAMHALALGTASQQQQQPQQQLAPRVKTSSSTNSSSSSNSSMRDLPAGRSQQQLPKSVRVAGQAVAAADAAHGLPGVALPPNASAALSPTVPAAAGLNSKAPLHSKSPDGNSSDDEGSCQQVSDISTWAPMRPGTAAVVNNIVNTSSSSIGASMGSFEGTVAGAGSGPGSGSGDGVDSAEGGDASLYWQSSVASGAMAGDSEDYPF